MSETLINDSTQKYWFRVRIMQIFSVSIAHTSSSVFSIAHDPMRLIPMRHPAVSESSRAAAAAAWKGELFLGKICLHPHWLTECLRESSGRKLDEPTLRWSSLPEPLVDDMNFESVCARENAMKEKTTEREKWANAEEFHVALAGLVAFMWNFGYFYGCTR